MKCPKCGEETNVLWNRLCLTCWEKEVGEMFEIEDLGKWYWVYLLCKDCKEKQEQYYEEMKRAGSSVVHKFRKIREEDWEVLKRLLKQTNRCDYGDCTNKPEYVELGRLEV